MKVLKFTKPCTHEKEMFVLFEGWICQRCRKPMREVEEVK